MISKNTLLVRGCLLASAFVLTACPGKEENEINAGISVHFAEIHSDASVSEATKSRQAKAAVSGGYDHKNLEHHHLVDQNGQGLSLYRTYLIIDNLALVPCTSVAQWPAILLDSLINSAYAHTEQGSEPVGERALDKPNVIDLITQNEFLLPLGDMSVAPGRYCGLQVELTRLAGEGYGMPDYMAASVDDPTSTPETPDLAGLGFALRADYCAERDTGGSCIRRAKVDIDDSALPALAPHVIEFATPLELNSDMREGFVALGIAYADWVHNVDVTRLTSDTEELRKLQDNIQASFYVHATGSGELPPNLAE